MWAGVKERGSAPACCQAEVWAGPPQIGKGTKPSWVLPWVWWQGGVWRIVVPSQECPVGSLTSLSLQGGQQP